MPAVVALEVSPTEVKVQMSHGKVISITGKGLDFVKRALQPKAKADIKIVPGSVLRLQSNKEGYWEITQIPQAEAAFIATEYNTGAIKAMVGGYDFALNKFNHVTQAWRQPGSSFKPFIYSAAIEKGFSPQTVINDAPIVLDPSETGFKKWNPKNFSGKFSGPIMMKDALKKSLNLVSIRILQAITPRYAVDFIQRFGFDSDKHPPHLSMALGAGSVTPWQMVEGFSVFANIGRRTEPYLISKVTDASGKVLMQSTAEAEKVAGVETRATHTSCIRCCTVSPLPVRQLAQPLRLNVPTSPARPVPVTMRLTFGLSGTPEINAQPSGWALTSPAA